MLCASLEYPAFSAVMFFLYSGLIGRRVVDPLNT